MGIEEFLLDNAKKEGKLEGIEEGIEKGIEKNSREIAIEMKKDGIPLTQIARFTKLSIEEIEKL